MAKKTHIFERFARTDHETFTFKVEKNTKKAVKETIQEIEDVFRKNPKLRILAKVDATVISGDDKLASLVAFSVYGYRNLGTHSMTVPVIDLDASYSSDFDEEDYKKFVKLRSRGGSWEEVAKTEDVAWATMNACLKEELNEQLDKLKEVTNRYKEVMSKEKEDRVKLQLSRKWSFGRYSTDLLSIYTRSFDEVARILNPSLQYNPSPSFQRDLVWSVEKKQAFIESIINEIPIGSFYVNMGEVYDPFNELGEGFGGLVWDGKQRLHALHSFILGEFDVEVDGKRVTYFDAPGYFNIRFENCSITIFESRFDDLKDIIRAYVVINQSQVKHTDEDLKKAIDYLQAKSQEGAKATISQEEIEKYARICLETGMPAGIMLDFMDNSDDETYYVMVDDERVLGYEEVEDAESVAKQINDYADLLKVKK